jgi:hypothetical protein
MSGLPKTRDQLLVIVELDIQYIKEKFDVVMHSSFACKACGSVCLTKVSFNNTGFVGFPGG